MARRQTGRQARVGAAVVLLTTPLLALGAVSVLWAATVTLQNGLEFQGDLGNISEVGQAGLDLSKAPAEGKATKIVLVDDALRRTFLPENQVRPGGLNFAPGPALERFDIPKRVARAGARIKSVGQFTRVEPFDAYGNRLVTMNTPKGPANIIQGITEVTPNYAKVEGLLVEGPTYIWDMRLSTTSLPRDVLSPLLLKAIDPHNPDDRLRLVRFYIQAERFHDAQAELEEVLNAFPQLVDKREQLSKLRQLAARRLIREIELRRDAGQHQLAIAMLEQFPSDGVAGVELLKVSDMLDEYKRTVGEAERILAQLQQHTGQLEDAALRERVERVRQEIAAELSLETLPRLADYARLADDDKLSIGQKLALAVSGWLLGSGQGLENLAVATSLHAVRDEVRTYLRSQVQPERDAALERLASMEGAQPASVARLLAHMKPPLDVPQTAAGDVPGLFQMQATGLPGEPAITYHVQLPPQYDPYRRYPCVLTLHGAGTTARQQVDWWSGAYNEKSQMRLGQASRHGYIVLAPEWADAHQYKYRYSAREHAAVMYSLLDACRHFSIDVDRVFLSGHSMGGDAAWDIGLAHPHLWAGVLPVVAVADKYIERYSENGRHLPMYFVSGEMDGNKIAQNAPQWNRYLTRHTYNVVIVEYRGRGHEHFHEEIQRMFDWMRLTPSRNLFRDEFTAYSMRAWDNAFWWAELSGFPPQATVAPANWDTDSGSARAGVIEGRVTERKRVTLRSAASQATIWLAPEMVDFANRVTVSFNNRSQSLALEPNIRDLLEDARTRSDRQHPFWVSVTLGR